MNATPASPPPEWVRRPERGNLPLLRFMAWLSLTAGRGASRVLLRAIAFYFFAFGGESRRAVRDFLRRCLGRAPSLAEQYRTFFDFAATIHDRLYFLRGRHELFDLDVHGRELFERPGGLLLMGGHFGSFESMRACGRGVQRRVAMAMYGAQAQMLTGVLQAVSPQATDDIVPLGELESMIRLQALLEEGALVGVLADRSFGGEPAIEVEFLGRPAPFPTGPMRMAAALRQRVIFMAGIYRGGNRYELRFEPLADFTALDSASRNERDAQVRAGVEAFARRLEHHVRAAPHNWFNFFDFWAPRR